VLPCPSEMDHLMMPCVPPRPGRPLALDYVRARGAPASRLGVINEYGKGLASVVGSVMARSSSSQSARVSFPLSHRKSNAHGRVKEQF
jgi:hypothetical protein